VTELGFWFADFQMRIFPEDELKLLEFAGKGFAFALEHLVFFPDLL
jgi:hypothetical protein